MRLTGRRNSELGTNSQDDEYMKLLKGDPDQNVELNTLSHPEPLNQTGRRFQLEGFVDRALEIPELEVGIGLFRYGGAAGIGVGVLSVYLHNKGAPAPDLWEGAAFGGVLWGGAGQVMSYVLERNPELWTGTTQQAEFAQRKALDKRLVRSSWLNIFTPESRALVAEDRI